MLPTTNGVRPGEVSRPRDRQREETRRRIFDAAMLVFRRDGVANARIEDIAELAHVSRGSFYFHFPTKDDVLSELLQASESRVADAIDGVAADAPVREVFEAVSTALALEWEDDLRIFPDVATLALRMAGAAPIGESQHTVRARLAARLAGAQELTQQAPAAVLADLFLINQFAAAIAWSGRPDVPLAAALKGMSTLFLYGAHRNDG